MTRFAKSNWLEIIIILEQKLRSTTELQLTDFKIAKPTEKQNNIYMLSYCLLPVETLKKLFLLDMK